MEIFERIETKTDYENWKKFLLNRPKEELAELLLDKMENETDFCSDMYQKFREQSSSAKETSLVIEADSVKTVIREYEREVEKELGTREPQLKRLQKLNSKVLERAENTEKLMDQLKLGVAVIVNMDRVLDAVMGSEAENQDLSLFETMETSACLLMDSIEKQELTIERVKEAADYLKSKSELYVAFDGINRIENVYQKLKTKALKNNDRYNWVKKGNTKISRLKIEAVG